MFTPIPSEPTRKRVRLNSPNSNEVDNSETKPPGYSPITKAVIKAGKRVGGGPIFTVRDGGWVGGCGDDAGGSLPSPTSPVGTVRTVRTRPTASTGSTRSPTPRPFKCPHCAFRFTRHEHLKRHLRIHTGEKPFTCPVATCQKRFTRADELVRHGRVHDVGRKKRGKGHASTTVTTTKMMMMDGNDEGKERMPRDDGMEIVTARVERANIPFTPTPTPTPTPTQTPTPTPTEMFGLKSPSPTTYTHADDQHRRWIHTTHPITFQDFPFPTSPPSTPRSVTPHTSPMLTASSSSSGYDPVAKSSLEWPDIDFIHTNEYAAQGLLEMKGIKLPSIKEWYHNM